MREKIRLFEQIELHQQQIFELFMKHPAILTYKLETIRDKVSNLLMCFLHFNSEKSVRISAISLVNIYITWLSIVYLKFAVSV